MVMKQKTMAWLSEIYNLILHPGTRQWEREQLVQAKNTLETQLATKQKAGKHEKESSNSLEDQQTKRVLEKLEASLRPLALRNNLTPNVAEFYQTISQSAPKKARNEETSKVQPVEVSVEPNETGEKAQEVAIFAGGCFWCMVEPFEDQPGILSVLSGYTGGTVPNPTYDQVLSGTTGHVEAVEIVFDPKIITYQDLLQLYWQVTDPTDAFGQFQDRGNFYRPIIFYTTAEQEVLAQEAKKGTSPIWLLSATHRDRDPQGHAVLASGKLPSSILQETAKALPADQASAQTTDAFLSAETLDKPRKKRS